jgi:hypothetical protein
VPLLTNYYTVSRTRWYPRESLPCSTSTYAVVRIANYSSKYFYQDPKHVFPYKFRFSSCYNTFLILLMKSKNKNVKTQFYCDPNNLPIQTFFFSLAASEPRALVRTISFFLDPPSTQFACRLKICQQTLFHAPSAVTGLVKAIK